MSKPITILISLLIFSGALTSQTRGSISGSYQSLNHYYNNNRWATNNYLKVNYKLGAISAGMQYEAYLPPIVGFPGSLKGSNLTDLFIRYSSKKLDLTAGTFYDQFGSGLSFRAYESRELGINTSITGARAVIRPIEKLKITGFYGKQREFLKLGSSIIKGVDGEFEFDSFFGSSVAATLGASIVNKYEDSSINAASFRLSLAGDNLNFNSEYVSKSNSGEALLISSTIFKDGLALFLSTRFLKNMEFRAGAEPSGIYGNLNYLPANTRQHSYLLANLYPYATQAMGEFSFQGELNYTIKKTALKVNFSHVRSLKNSSNSGKPILLSAGEDLYYQDFNIEVTGKLSKNLKSVFTFINLKNELVNTNTLVADLRYKISTLLSLNTQIQHLWTSDDHKNWAAVVMQLGFAPHWRVYFSDMTDYQYSNKQHYLNAGVGYSTKKANISVGYGKQKEGMVCAGGICQWVPAYKGADFKVYINF